MAGRIRIKLGDNVEIISGRDKGTRGEVIQVLPDHGRVVVQGANVRKKHQRQVQAGGKTMSPGIITFEAPIHISNVMLVCPKCKELSRVGFRREDGVKVRVCKKCEEIVDS